MNFMTQKPMQKHAGRAHVIFTHKTVLHLILTSQQSSPIIQREVDFKKKGVNCMPNHFDSFDVFELHRVRSNFKLLKVYKCSELQRVN